jgi:hypothetical protein
MNCINCGKNPYVKSEIQTLAESKEIKFWSDGKILTEKAKRYSDAFYEIVVGKYKGCLVHIWDLVKV